MAMPAVATTHITDIKTRFIVAFSQRNCRDFSQEAC
jgi:hypothetical protein